MALYGGSSLPGKALVFFSPLIFFFFFWLHWIFTAAYRFSAAASRLSLVAVRGSFSCCGAWVLLWVCSIVWAHGLSYRTDSGILVSWPGIEAASPALGGRSLTSGPPGKSKESYAFEWTSPIISTNTEHPKMFPSTRLILWWSDSTGVTDEGQQGAFREKGWEDWDRGPAFATGAKWERNTHTHIYTDTLIREVECVHGQSCLALCKPMDHIPPGSSVHGIFQAKNTGARCHFLLQGIFPTQGANLHLLHCRQILCHLSHQGHYKGD